MNRSTTEIPKDMFKSLKTISLSLAALLLGASSACGQQSDSYAHKVNTLIGTRGVGLTSGYLYPGATYPFGMVQFTPTYFAKRGGFVINQLSGGGCSHMGNFPTFPVGVQSGILYTALVHPVPVLYQRALPGYKGPPIAEY